MPSFTHNSFVCRAETIEMSSILFQRGCSWGLVPVSLYDESIASLATVQDSACEVCTLKILLKKLQRGGKWGHHPITIWIWSSLQCSLLQRPSFRWVKSRTVWQGMWWKLQCSGKPANFHLPSMLNFQIPVFPFCNFYFLWLEWLFIDLTSVVINECKQNIYFTDQLLDLIHSEMVNSLIWRHLKLHLQDSAS